MKVRILFLLSLLLAGFGCNADDEDPTPEPAFTCINLTDFNGQPVGRYGDCSDDTDWKNTVLTTPERNFFNPPEVLSWGTGDPVTVTRDIAAFPNPVAPNGQILVNAQFSTETTLLLRLAIVSEDQEVLIVGNFFPEQTNAVTLALQLPENQFQQGQTYRLYYQFWSTPNNIIYEGYGDILVCAVNDFSKIEELCF